MRVLLSTYYTAGNYLKLTIETLGEGVLSMFKVNN